MSLARIWLLSLLVKLVLGALLPLYHDEAYYWVWARNLQWSYYDHPPMIAWLLAAGRPFESLLQAVRWPGILLAHAALLVWLPVLRRHLPEKKVRWWMLLMLLSPLTGPGSLVMTPDIPLLFFWSLAVYWFDRAFAAPRIRDVLLLGLTLGLGFCSKYHIVLFGPIAIALIVMRRRWAWFLPSRIAVGLLGLAVGAAPVLLWNAQNGFVSFAFQLRHGLGGGSWDPMWTLEYLGGQLLILFPPVAYFAFRRRPDRETMPWLLLGTFPLVFFLFTSFKGKVEANWTTVAYPALLALALRQGMSRRVLRFVLGFWIVGLALVLADVAGGFLPMDPPPKTREYDRFEALMEMDVRPYQPLYARSYQMAAQMSYAHRTSIPKLRGMRRIDFYDQRPESRPTSKRYFVAIRRGQELPDWAREEGHEIRRRIPVDERHEIAEVGAP